MTVKIICSNFGGMLGRPPSIPLLASRKRERGCTHAKNYVYHSKIENSFENEEHVSHPMLVC